MTSIWKKSSPSLDSGASGQRWFFAAAPAALVGGLFFWGGAPVEEPSVAPLQATCPDPATITGDLQGPISHVRYLADDALAGREVASPGARCAAGYLAARFRELGLEPAGPDGSWFQTFEIRGGARVGSGNALRWSGASYTVDEDWIPLGFSASGRVEAPSVYGGYGISRPGDPEDRFVRLDVEGKVLVVEHGSPDGPTAVHGDPHFKATIAAGRRAAALIVLLPDDGPVPDVTGEVRAQLAIPVAAVAGPAARKLRAAAENGGSVTVETDVTPKMVEARNVVATLPGADPELADEWVVIGAHYDHLGLGGEGSLDPDAYGTIHNGADDNASGTAALLEVAARLLGGPRLGRSVLFIAFTGEEKGLWGSAAYVREPLEPLERTVAMLNMDMVGRLENGRLTVFGFETAPEWREIVDLANDSGAEPLRLAYVDDGFGPSDHSSFYARGVPVLHFFTNTHADYHRPTDDWDKIDAEGIVRVSDLVAEIAERVAGTPEVLAASLTPARSTPDPHGGGLPAPTSGDEPSSGRGYGPYLGTIPDMTPSDFGVRLTGVREDSPAAEAGIRGGDVVVEFEGTEITDLYAYTYALRAHEPGDTVKIVVEREGERVELTAVLGLRR